MKLINWRLVITALFLSVVACKKQKSDIGLGIQENQLSTFVDESTNVVAQSFKIDSTRTDNDAVNNFLVGNYHDPLVGDVKTSIFTQIIPLSLSPNQTIFENTSIESTSLHLELYLTNSTTQSKYSYGTGEQIGFDVFEISEGLDQSNEAVYYSNNSLANNDQSLVDQQAETYKPLYDVEKILRDGKITIPLNDYFATKMQNSSVATFSSTDNFLNYFKGIKIISTTEDGKVIAFDLAKSYIRIKYRKNDNDVLLNYDFSLSNLTKSFTNIDIDYSLNFDQDTLISDQYLFIQGGGSLITKISFTDLLDNNTAGEIFNLAEIVLPADSSNIKNFPGPSLESITVLKKDAMDDWEPIRAQISYKNYAYHVNITTYIQEVVNRTTENDDIYLYVDYNTKRISTSRFPINKDEIKLRLIHTE